MSKEKMLEFVRNAIIMANNPGCETLEDALEKEYRLEGCLLEVDNIINDDILIIKLYTPEVKYLVRGAVVISQLDKDKNIVDSSKYRKGYHQELYKKVSYDDISLTKYIRKILGLPITLERLLIALG
jgi:hypothetical protein